MFFDEVLEEAYKKGVKAVAETIYNKLIEILGADTNMDTFITELKQANNGYKLFVKRHPDEFVMNGFEKALLNRVPQDSKEKWKKSLGW